jgi:hypothetical protein
VDEQGLTDQPKRCIFFVDTERRPPDAYQSSKMGQ